MRRVSCLLAVVVLLLSCSKSSDDPETPVNPDEDDVEYATHYELESESVSMDASGGSAVFSCVAECQVQSVITYSKDEKTGDGRELKLEDVDENGQYFEVSYAYLQEYLWRKKYIRIVGEWFVLSYPDGGLTKLLVEVAKNKGKRRRIELKVESIDENHVHHVKSITVTQAGD